METQDTPEKGRFGKRDGAIVHVSELQLAERGLKCRCTCPSCGDRLVARLGDVRIHHFSHRAGGDCSGNRESALHALAKEVFESHDRFMMPDAVVSGFGDERVVAPAQNVSYSGVQPECAISGVRADVALHRTDPGKKPFLIEVAVTHFVDKEKEARLEDLGYPCIEIDLSDAGLDFHAFDRDELERLLIHEVTNKRWICIPDKARHLKTLRIAAEERMTMAEKAERDEAERTARAEGAWKARVDRIMCAEYQAVARSNRNREPATHDGWKSTRRQLGIPNDADVPYYLNHKSEYEFLFTCNRIVWESAVFLSWVHNKRKENRNPDIPIWHVAENFLKQHGDLVERDIVYAKKDVYRGPRLQEAFTEYFCFLERCGFVEKAWEGRKGAAVFMCVKPGLILLPAEYNNPRYLPRDGGVLDKETGEAIRFASTEEA